MPRITKDTVGTSENKKEKSKTTKSKASVVKSALVEEENNKIPSSKTTKNKATKATTTKKKTTAKTSTVAKKTTTKATKPKSTKSVGKSTTSTSKTKKATTNKATTAKKNVANKIDKVPTRKPIDVLEYYDLPYRYNQTVVKLLAQTPYTLFVYWDISDTDKQNFKEQYGDNFFNNTKPVLVVKNKTMNYAYEVEINDFANSWYLHINDSKCDYEVELGRRPLNKQISIPNDYLFVTKSNNIEAPNDHILFETLKNPVLFMNTKTNNKFSKTVKKLTYVQSNGKIFKIDKFYTRMYENISLSNNQFDFRNPSSANPTSTFK